MRDKSIGRLAWILCVFVIIAAVIAAFSGFLDRSMGDNILGIIGSATIFLTFVAFAVMGALIITHQPHNTVGWLLMIEATLVFVWPVSTYFNNLVQAPTQPTPLTLLGLWIYSWTWLWYIFPILFIPLFFPTGRPPSHRWRWLIALGLGLCLFFILFATFSPEFVAQDESWSVPNPIGFLVNIEFPIGAWSVFLLSFATLCVAALFVRYRRAHLVEREQIKWLLYAAGLFFVIYSIAFLFNEVDGILSSLLGISLDLAILTMPVAIAIAILRHSLYDINLIIRKTLIYALLSGLLALVYFGLVLLLQTAFDKASSEQSPIVIVISTLVIAALFAPLRRRVQELIDRRFFRKKYDAQQVLARFAQSARDETEMEALTADLVRVVQDTMQPEQVNVWLKARKR